MTGKFVAYYRVSTGKQRISGLGLEAQRDAVADYLNGGRWTLLEEVTEVESGKNSDRPQLALVFALCDLHKATLIVAKLDRLARNLHFLSGLMEASVDSWHAIYLPPIASRFTYWPRWPKLKPRYQ